MWHDAVEGVGQRRAWGKHALSLSRGCHGKQSEFNTAGRSVSPLDYGRLGAANLELEFFLAFTRVIPFTVDSKFPLQLWAMAHGPHGLSLVSGLCLSVPFAFVLLVAIPRSYLFLARPQQSLSNNERTLCVLWHFQHGEQDGALIRKIWNIQIMYSHIRYYSMNKNIEIRLSKGDFLSVSKKWRALQPTREVLDLFVAKASGAEVVAFATQEAHYPVTAEAEELLLELGYAERSNMPSWSSGRNAASGLAGVAAALGAGLLLLAVPPLALAAAASAGTAAFYGGRTAGDEVACRRHWMDLLSHRLGPAYLAVESQSLLQMRLLIFVRSGGPCAGATASTLAVPLDGARLGTKGGIATLLNLPDGSCLGFVAAHLAAHEGGPERAALRCSQAAALLEALQSLSSAAGGGRLCVFMLGDLNFRLDPAKLPPPPPGAPACPADCPPERAAAWAAAAALGRDGISPSLAAADELCAALAARPSGPLRSLREARVGFPPTFKIAPASQPPAGLPTYAAKRVPAWTDRVLYGEIGQGGSAAAWTATPQLYDVARGGDSDHLPVFCTFALDRSLNAGFS